jgi:hypothetical protein
VFYATPGGDTEDSYHCFWDELIRRPLSLFCPQLKYQRNTKNSTSTAQNRPDVSAVINGIAIWRGEEKGPDTDNDAKLELTSKFEWNDYYEGTNVTICNFFNHLCRYTLYACISRSCDYSDTRCHLF